MNTDRTQAIAAVMTVQALARLTFYTNSMFLIVIVIIVLLLSRGTMGG